MFCAVFVFCVFYLAILETIYLRKINIYIYTIFCIYNYSTNIITVTDYSKALQYANCDQSHSRCEWKVPATQAGRGLVVVPTAQAAPARGARPCPARAARARGVHAAVCPGSTLRLGVLQYTTRRHYSCITLQRSINDNVSRVGSV